MLSIYVGREMLGLDSRASLVRMLPVTSLGSCPVVVGVCVRFILVASVAVGSPLSTLFVLSTVPSSSIWQVTVVPLLGYHVATLSVELF